MTAVVERHTRDRAVVLRDEAAHDGVGTEEMVRELVAVDTIAAGSRS